MYLDLNDDDDLQQLIEDILDPEEGALLQIVYLKQKNGTLIPFVGPMLTKSDFEAVEGLGLGESFQVMFDDAPENAYLQ